MKIFTSISVVLFCCSINTYANEFKFVAGDNSSATQICMAAVTDNTKALIMKLKRLRLSGTAGRFRKTVNSLQCNDQFIGHFAKTYNAQKTLAYLDKYTNRKNKRKQANISIKDFAYEQGKDKQKTIVVLIASK